MPVNAALFALFVGLPLLDLWLTVVVLAPRIGGWGAVALVVATGMLGAALAKLAGAQALRGVLGALRAGRAPGPELLSAALVLAGALLLITPGVLTDFLGLALLLPPTRALAGRLVMRFLRDRISFEAMIGRTRLPIDPFGTATKDVVLREVDRPDDSPRPAPPREIDGPRDPSRPA